MSKPKLSIGISIGKNDLDIAAWYNMLKANHLPVSTWTSYAVLAFVYDSPLDIGTVKIEKKKEQAQASLMFGSGNTQNTEKESKRGWKKRGSKGEFVEGSIIMVPIYKEDVVFALKKLKEKGVAHSSAVKSIIRKYLKVGDQTIPPQKRITPFEGNELILNGVDKNELRNVTENLEEPDCTKDGLRSPGRKKKSKTFEEKRSSNNPEERASDNPKELSGEKQDTAKSGMPQSGVKNPLLDFI